MKRIKSLFDSDLIHFIALHTRPFLTFARVSLVNGLPGLSMRKRPARTLIERCRGLRGVFLPSALTAP